MVGKKLVCMLLIVTVGCLFLPEMEARTACEEQARKNYSSDVADCAISYGIGAAGCFTSVLLPMVFAACQFVASGMLLYCEHRASLQYRDTLETCDQESG